MLLRPQLPKRATALIRWTRTSALIDAVLVVTSAAFAVLAYHSLGRTHRASAATPVEQSSDAARPRPASSRGDVASARFHAHVAAGVECASALRVWAAEDPAGALAWARTQSEPGRLGVIVAALEGAAAKPDEAVRLARALLQAEPALAADCEPALVGALIRADAFGAALDFVQTGPAELRATSLTTLFAAWVRRDPAFAGELATMFGAEGLRGHAFDTVMRSWASVAPTQAIDFALRLPTGEARSVAFRAALAPWVAQNPAAVAERLGKLSDPAERDAATCAWVCATDTANRPTLTALSWTETVGDPTLRVQALRHLLPEWAEQNPVAARSYLESAVLTPTQREELRTVLRTSQEDDGS